MFKDASVCGKLSHQVAILAVSNEANLRHGLQPGMDFYALTIILQAFMIHIYMTILLCWVGPWDRNKYSVDWWRFLPRDALGGMLRMGLRLLTYTSDGYSH